MSERTVTSASDTEGRHPATAFQLITVFAPGRVEARVRLVDDRPLVIGREPDAGGVVLPDAEASRQHARLVRDAGGAWTLTDLGSRNGVHVDGVACTTAELVDGSVIRVGGSLLVFVAAEVAADAMLAGEDEHLLGASVRMQAVRGELAQVAPRNLPVLLLGESGTGKERAARAIHARSGRAGALVTVNCAAISPSLAETELFGHVAGAFTGAATAREGMFVAADRGTLFLDEIGDMPLDLQAKLLRALAIGEVRPVGGKVTTVDVRVVAATLVNLEHMVKAGTFRGDLFARLAGWMVTLPPLRRRRDDILPLAMAWLGTHAPGARLSPGAAEALLLHAWPYNVRELHHALELAVARAGDGVLRAGHLPAPIVALASRRAQPTAAEAPLPLALAVDRTAAVPSAEDLRTVLAYHHGSIALTAAFFERDRKQVYRWLERHAIDPGSFRE